ncbi:hypothetical protein SISNIDRAFT_100658 [Sistotremastrum niveocremeum HHB9708]|uniref:Uncharacterized protein n=1 Tax=Sistotremastrum niveocremeum HHB9708 TaxID=1314777 RepID=A0A164UC18_9AGAM|nr:hypothetical protein SISNIDRAFT_100658 [Sistotremastrum niveocremeum HHB9708]
MIPASTEHLYSFPSRHDISYHARRRLYAESLEQYCLRLEAHLKSMGITPVPFERASHSHRGLSPMSAATMIAVMHEDAMVLYQNLDIELTTNESHTRHRSVSFERARSY